MLAAEIGQSLFGSAGLNALAIADPWHSTVGLSSENLRSTDHIGIRPEILKKQLDNFDIFWRENGGEGGPCSQVQPVGGSSTSTAIGRRSSSGRDRTGVRLESELKARAEAEGNRQELFTLLP
jgi:hypothetical protein